jgi:imidazolonepropionase-like amidohydrolase
MLLRLLSLLFLCGSCLAQTTLLQGGTVHTITGPAIEHGSILVRDGKIIGVGRNLSAPEGSTIIDITGKHVYPGMIDSGATTDAEQVQAARGNGVTSVVPLPTGVLFLRFPSIATTPVPSHDHDEDDEEPTTAVEAAPVSYKAAKKEFDQTMKELNSFFRDARRYRTDPRFEALQPVLNGSTPLFVAASREREIRDAIAFADAQKIRIILADPYEAYKVLPLIKSHNIPVVLGPTFTLPLDSDDDYDRSYTTPAVLYKAGIKFAIATFSTRLSRNLPYQAAAAVPFGLPRDEAYKAVSLNAAEILGMGKRLGSIDEGKIANLIVTDGDPLETTTHITQAFIDGKPVSLETRQKQLYEKYLARP